MGAREVDEDGRCMACTMQSQRKKAKACHAPFCPKRTKPSEKPAATVGAQGRMDQWMLKGPSAAPPIVAACVAAAPPIAASDAAAASDASARQLSAASAAVALVPSPPARSARSTPRVLAADFNGRSAREYLEMPRDALDRIWQREMGELGGVSGSGGRSARALSALNSALSTRASSARRPDSGGGQGALAAADEASVELALTSVLSLARTTDGAVVRRVLV